MNDFMPEKGLKLSGTLQIGNLQTLLSHKTHRTHGLHTLGTHAAPLCGGAILQFDR